MTDNIQQRLVIRIGQTSLSFSTTKGTEVVYEDYPLNSSISIAANMREALSSVPLLTHSYHRVLVMVDSPVLMVPLPLFHEEEQEVLYRHAFSKVEHAIILSTILPYLNAVAVYAVAKDLRTVLADAFPHVTFVAALSPLWKHLHERSYTGQRQKLYGYFHEQRLDVMSFSQKRFKFYNSYYVTNVDDALYYLLAAWKQLGLAAEQDELFLAGHFEEKDLLTEKAKQFLKRVFYVNPAGEFNRAAITQFSDIPYDLVTLYMKGL